MGILWPALGASCQGAGQRAACQELGKAGETLPAFTPELWHPVQGTPSPSSTVVPCCDGLPGSGAGCGGCGEWDLPTDVYWQFANVKKGPLGAGGTQLPGAACVWGESQPG